MAPKKKTAAKTAAPHKGRKKTAGKTKRVAAKAHSAAAPSRHAARGAPYHTYTDHRSDSYKHYASIMKTVILFLGFVLLLAIIANIFAPSITNRPAMHTAQNFLDTRESGYKAASPALSGGKQYKYVLPEGTSSTSAGAPASPAAGTPKTATQQ